MQLPLTWHWWYIVPVLGAAVLLLSQLLPGAGSLRVPIAVYALAISFMMIMAVARHGKVTQESFQWVLAGAITFAVSDSAIAWN
eukprot:2191274-Amphidinium_carterae.1